MSRVLAYFLCLTAAALFCSVLLSLAPKNGASRVLRFGCGLLVILTALSPLLRLDSRAVASWLSELQLFQTESELGLEIPTKDLAARLISEKLQSYVLDKALSMGLQMEAEVSMQTDGAYPYPERIRIRGHLDEAQKMLLSDYIARELAIPADRQVYEE